MTAALAKEIHSVLSVKLDAVSSGFYGRDRKTATWKKDLANILSTIGEDGQNLLRNN